MGSKSTRPYEQSIREVAEDIAGLISRFCEEEGITARPSYKALTRVWS